MDRQSIEIRNSTVSNNKKNFEHHNISKLSPEISKFTAPLFIKIVPGVGTESEKVWT